MRCFGFFYILFVKHFSFYEELNEILSKMYVGRKVTVMLVRF
jgi:hypothetical protein